MTFAAVLAFLNSLAAPLKGYLLANGLNAALHASPLLLVLLTFGFEYLTGGTWGLLRAATIAAGGAVLALQLTGKLNINLP